MSCDNIACCSLHAGPMLVKAVAMMTERWMEVDRCPGCDGRDSSARGKLPRRHYNFLGDIIPLPESGVGLAECNTCGLYFKTVLPCPGFLAEVFAGKAGTLWNDSYPFRYEKDMMLRLADTAAPDLLDIGPSNGALLEAFADLPGRRSGLDLFKHPGLEDRLRGEFITGLLDQPDLTWSGEPYDIVSAFDVFEHFYSPLRALANLAALVRPGGVVLLETGNIGSAWARRVGPECWRYTNLFEHHVFWRPESLRYLARQHGFDVLHVQQVDHKGWRGASGAYKLRQLLKYAMWRLVPGLYRGIAGRLEEDGSIAPQIPFTRDHMNVALRRR